MENDEMNTYADETLYRIYIKLSGVISRDRYQFELILCLTLGILFGCVTQSVYGGSSDWKGVLAGYCAGFLPSLRAVFPVTLGFVAAVFAVAPFAYVRLLIYPLSAVRAMGLGALCCGALQCGSLREVSFASIVLLPYAAVNCLIAVYAGEYALGLRESFTGENQGLTRSLIVHTLKMLSCYLALAALSCVVFALSCLLFGIYLI